MSAPEPLRSKEIADFDWEYLRPLEGMSRAAAAIAENFLEGQGNEREGLGYLIAALQEAATRARDKVADLEVKALRAERDKPTA